MPHPSAPNAYPSALNAYPSGPDGVAGVVVGVELEEAVRASSDTLLAGSTVTLEADPITPAAGDVVVVKAGTWGSSVTILAVGGGALEWQPGAEVSAVSGRCPARLWTATVGQDPPSSLTVSVTFRNSAGSLGDGSFTVERWSGGTVGATKATAGAAPPQTTIPSSTVGAVVTWGGFDYNGAVSDLAPVYLSGAQPSVEPFVDGGQFAAYQAWQPVASAGTQTVGLSAPSGQKTSFVAVELIPRVQITEAAPIQRLVDDFDTAPLSPTRWAYTYSQPQSTRPAVVDGEARVYCESAAGSPLAAGIRSAPVWGLFGSEASVEVAKVPSGAGATGPVVTSLIVDAPSVTEGRRLVIQHRADLGVLQFRHEYDPALVGSAPYQDSAALQVTYLPEVHRWWRIRYVGSDIVFDTSPDQQAWTVQRTITAPTWAGVGDMRLTLESYRSNGTNDYAAFASVNVPAAQPPEPTPEPPPRPDPVTVAEPLTRVPTTRLLVADTVTGRVGWELPFTTVSWTQKLNGIGTLSATLVIEDLLDSMWEQGAANPANALRETLGGPNRFSYIVTHGDVALWAGPMQPSQETSADAPTVQIGGSGIESLLDKRVLIGFGVPAGTSWSDAARDLRFEQTNPAAAVYQVVQSVITSSDEAPGRQLPITCSSPPAVAGDETFTYLSYDLTTAWKAIGELAKRDDGPDVRFVPQLAETSTGLYLSWDLQVGDPFLASSGPLGPNGPEPWTFDDTTSAIARSGDAVGTATSWFTGGSGQDRAKQIARATSTKLTSLGFPAMEVVEASSASETEQWKLQAAAQGAIAAHETPTEKWTVTARADGDPPVGTYMAGDAALLEVLRNPLIDPGRYERRMIEVSGGDGPTVTITCEPDGQDDGGV